MEAVIGWDIGGAHLKAARVEGGRLVATRQAATPLWLGLQSLEVAFDSLKAELGPADRHAVTMTGELCDAFRSRRDGVVGLTALAGRLLAPSPIVLYAGRAGFVGSAEIAERAADIASANWRASAEVLARSRRPFSSTSARRLPTSFRSSPDESPQSANRIPSGSSPASSSTPA